MRLAVLFAVATALAPGCALATEVDGVPFVDSTFDLIIGLNLHTAVATACLGYTVFFALRLFGIVSRDCEPPPALLLSLLIVPAVATLMMGYVTWSEPFNFDGPIQRAIKNAGSPDDVPERIMRAVGYSAFIWPFLFIAAGWGMFTLTFRRIPVGGAVLVNYGLLAAVFIFQLMWIASLA